MKKKKPVTVIWHPFRRDEYFSKLRKGNIFGIIRELFRDLRRCHERIWKGYCDYDLFEIDTWFLGIMPNMLEEFRDMTNGYPSSFVGLDAEGITQEDKEEAEFAAWQGELSKMAFLLREADETTCSVRNPNEEEYDEAFKRFSDEYGILGEKLDTEGSNTVHFMDEIEEYKPISDRYFAEEYKNMSYRDWCCQEGLKMFVKYFRNLWD